MARLKPVGLRELNVRAGLQTRVDSKYLITVGDLDRLITVVGPTTQVLQLGERHSQTYDTVYFDSADLGCYGDHLQRRRLSYKLRTRVYVGSGLRVFEVKLRDGRGATVKVKIDHEGEPAVIGPVATAFYRESIKERYGFEPTREFIPSLRNCYVRITLAGTDSAERTTVDHALRFLDPTDGTVVGALREDLVLIETKSATGAGSVDRALWGLGIRPRRVSKYCIGVGFVHPERASNRYHRASAYAFTGRRIDATEEGTAEPAPAPPVSIEDLPRRPRAPRPRRAPRPPRPPRVG